MKRAEQLAWGALAGLVVIMVILITGGAMYHFTAYWAGAMLVGGQAVVVGLAAWGLLLARQARELNEIPAETAASGFRMGAGDDTTLRSNLGKMGRLHDDPHAESRTLDTGFQRLLVALAGIALTVLGVWAGWLVYGAYRWTVQNPGEPLVVAGPFSLKTGDKPIVFDEPALLVGLAATFIYGVLYWITRPRRDAEGFGEAAGSAFTLGLTGMAALGVASVLAYFHYAWASEMATGVLAFFMLLEGLELLVNSMRNYSSIEEMDQEAVDLHATPLGPMLGSIWLAGLRMLFAQSVGLSEGKAHERGVMARMMPRVLVAVVVIAIGVSCVRVVQPGTVAVLERLGYSPVDDKGNLQAGAMLDAGLHFTYPWPIDQLVVIPTQQLQTTDVGTELHSPKEWKGIDFQFWKLRDPEAKEDAEDLFRTGDPGGGQVLETYVQVLWRVTDPEKFYSAISHSEFVDKSKSEAKAEGKALPIYEAIVQQCTSFAVTRTFAIHSLEQIMIGDRREVETHCREILQQKLDDLHCGVSVSYLTIKDLHPPFGAPGGDRYDPSEPRIGGVIRFTPTGIVIDPSPNNTSQVARGPASAFEFVISMREFKEQMIDLTRAEITVKMNQAEAFAAVEKKKAEGYKLDKVAKAHGEADRLMKMIEGLDPQKHRFELDLMMQQLHYNALKDLLDPVNKYIVDPSIKVQLNQTSDKGAAPVLPR